MKKQIVLCILIIALCLSMVLPAAAMELTFTDSSAIQHGDAVQALVNDGVIRGYPDGSFNPGGTLTRAEACTILTRLMNGQANGVAPFNDVVPEHWASGYIGFCAAQGIVAGYGDGNFGPEDTLTGAQWSKMLLGVMGYDADALGMLGTTWQLGVANLANATDLYAGIGDFNADAAVSRDAACQIAYNGLYRSDHPTPGPINGEGMLSQLSYSFSNSRQDFDYPRLYRIPYARYAMIFGDTEKAYQLYQRDGRWGGNCFGISGTTGMFYQSGNGISTSAFSTGASVPNDLAITDSSNDWGITLKEFIETVQISQYADRIQEALGVNMDKTAELCAEVERFQGNGANPVIIGITGSEGGHALVGYEIAVQSDTESRLMVYDSNYPNDGTRYITLTKNAQGQYTGWSYPIADSVIWGSGRENASISYAAYADYYPVWEQREGSTRTSDMAFLTTNTDVTVTDSTGNPVADIRDGQVTAYRPDVYPLNDFSIRLDEDLDEQTKTSVWLPIDGYTVARTESGADDDFEVTFTQVEQSANVVTNADTVSFNVNDAEKTRTVSMDAAEAGSDYTITLRAAYDTEDEPGTIILTGEVAGEGIHFGQEDGELVLDGVDLYEADLTVDRNRSTADPSEMIAQTAEEYVARGDAYLAAGETEEHLAAALADYLTAIELDPGYERAYLGAADVYIRQRNYDAAREILQLGMEAARTTDGIQAKLAELDSNTIVDTSGRTRRMNAYNNDGALIWYHEYTYSTQRRPSAVTAYDGSGNAIGHIDFRYDAEGKTLIGYWRNDQGEVGKMGYQYDENGYLMRMEHYDTTGELSSYRIFHYDEAGLRVREDDYTAEGTLLSYSTYEYDDQGREIRENIYDAGGELTDYQTREYDAQGRLHKYTYGHYDGHERYDLYYYNDAGRMIKTEIYENGELMQTLEYETET